MYSDKMKRKVAKVGTLRLSPNEEALILKQERERRRKLRLQQVREQEKFIAQQFRQDVKERRDQQLQQMAEELRSKWESAQAEKLQSLEKIYLSTLNAIGEGHRQAKENEPDLEAMERVVAVNKEKAEKRHREALKELKQQRDKQLRNQTWHIEARRKALNIEKERSEKIASLPPPPPDPLENLEVVKRLPLVKICNVDSFSASHYHLPEAYVDREMDTEQLDARAAAVEEGKRLDALQKEEERERLEQMEKANLRGSHALKMVQLTQDRDRLMKELEQMQQDDLTRRRQIVAKMPQQLFEPAYRRAEIREDWQRELESAFEDIYTRDTKMKGDMVLHLKPQPLPEPSVTSLDEDLDLSVEPEALSDVKRRLVGPEDTSPAADPQEETRVPQSRLVLKKLLSRIRTQKDQWSGKSDAETVSDTLETGPLPIVNGEADVPQGEEDTSGGDTQFISENTILAGKSVLLHPQEQAMRIRMEAERRKKAEDLERQKQEQVELLSKLEEEQKRLEAEYYKKQQEADRTQVGQERVSVEDEKPEPLGQENEPVSSAPVTEMNTSGESLHIQIIREYQQRLLQQNRQHKQSADEARKRLQEYQVLLKRRYPHLSTSNQESTNHGPESTGTYNNCKTSGALSPAPDRTVTVPLQATDPSRALVSANQPIEQRRESHVLIGSGRLIPTSVSTSEEQLEMVPSSPTDFLAQHVDSHKLTSRARSPVIIPSPSSSIFSVERHPQVRSSHTDAHYQSPDEDRVRPQHSLVGSEKYSSTSSPGEQDTSSGTSYHPLPSALSLGLTDIEFSEPNIPLTMSLAHLRKIDIPPLRDFSNVHEFRKSLLSSSAEIHAQQDQLKELQAQLDKKRESLLSKQKIHEEQLLQKQLELEEQIRKHQESLGNLLGSREPSDSALPADVSQIPKNERFNFMSTLLKALDDNREDVRMTDYKEPSNGGLIRPPGREQRWRPSKPPVTKTKLGPQLQQHELSAIMELETPTSGRLSTTGLEEQQDIHIGLNNGSGREEPVSYNPEISKKSRDSTLRDLDLSRLSASSKDQSCNDSANWSHTKLSWRELLSLEVSHDQGGSGPPCTPAEHRDLHGFSANSSKEVADWLGKAAAHGSSPDAFCDYLSTTTISTGSFLTSEKTDSSPVNFGQDRCSNRPAAANTLQHEMSWDSYRTPGEKHSPSQQIIEKYTKDLSASLQRNLSFHSPEAAVDTSATDNHFPMTFHPLDPKPDLSISTPSYARSHTTSSSLYSGELSQTSINTSSQEQQPRRSPLPYLSHTIPVLSSSPGLLHSQRMNVENRSPGKQKEASVIEAAVDTSATDNHFPMTFHPLDPKPDLSISTPSYARSHTTSSSLYSGELSQTSINTSSQEQQPRRSPLSHTIPALSSSPGLLHSQRMNVENRSPGKQKEASVTEAAVDTSATDNHFPMTFHPLDPKPDLSISTPSYARSHTTSSSLYSGELSQTSINTSSQEQQPRRSPLPYLPHTISALSSSPGLLHSQRMNTENRSPGKQKEASDSSGLFLPLHPEHTLNEADLSSQNEVSSRLSAHGLDNVRSGAPTRRDSSLPADRSHEYDAIQSSSKPVLRRNAAEDTGSFHELMATQMTVNDSELSEPPVSDFLEKKAQPSVHYEELLAVHDGLHGEGNPGTVGHDPQNSRETAALPGRGSYSDSGTAAALHSSNRIPRSESITHESLSGGSSARFLSSFTIGSSADSLPSCVHTWDSESARGILEEPDLTLVSFNDSSVACSEPTLNPASTSDLHETSTSQNAFQPLPAEVDVSGVPASEHSSVGTSLSEQFAELGLEFISTPGSLQEAFLMKKRHLIEKSSKRIQEMKERDRVPKKMDLQSRQKDKPVSQAEQRPHSDTAGSDGGHLKKVVEVRVCTPEDRKLSEIEMHQRTIRLYNRLDEVKTRKEEMMRQESYSRNREKAKAFKKRTLEKLRANKMK
ncbi:centrosomal protein of 295 kDa isoform X2 [Pseudophryne corroboree]|uniref:centrosomal protein of 295 kDa isoform X2 n=1 Tax=Pseudophryne corroboree TaxID=495146 RepID=UPI003081B1B5